MQPGHPPPQAHIERVSRQPLRFGIFPTENVRKDKPFIDGKLIKIPLKMDGDFMTMAYQAFFCIKFFFANDARALPPDKHPHAADRFIMKELEARREMTVVNVISFINAVCEANVVESSAIEDIPASEVISYDGVDLFSSEVAMTNFVPEPK
jgi:hypothetical protein